MAIHFEPQAVTITRNVVLEPLKKVPTIQALRHAAQVPNEPSRLSLRIALDMEKWLADNGYAIVKVEDAR